MKEKKLKQAIICYNECEEKKEILEFLSSEKLLEILEIFDYNIIIVLWWDWTMLRAIRKHYLKNIPFLWINFWNKWFLLNALKYFSKEFIYRNYPLLEISVNINWIQKKEIAINEIDITSRWKMIWLDICLKNNQKLNLLWDWVVICTPAWSTWYNSSLWWPIIPHTLNAFAITPKAVWQPKSQSAILINDNENIFIENTWRKHKMEIFFDGREFLEIPEWSDVKIKIKKSNYNANLIIFKDYTHIWDNKVLQEQWFEQKQ